jgi:hypothetical protein
MPSGHVPVFPGGLDRAGVVLSSACALHCALMPAVAGVLPIIGLNDVVPETVESMLLLTSVIVAMVSLAGGCRHHRQWRPWLFLFGGLALISVGRLLLDEVRWFETGIVTTGALLIATAHLVNSRLCCASRC